MPTDKCFNVWNVVKSAQVPEIKCTHGVLEDPDQRGKELRRRRARLRNAFKIKTVFKTVFISQTFHGVGPEPVLVKRSFFLCVLSAKGRKGAVCFCYRHESCTRDVVGHTCGRKTNIILYMNQLYYIWMHVYVDGVRQDRLGTKQRKGENRRTRRRKTERGRQLNI